MYRSKILRQLLFAAATTTALGFGAVQAFAAPTGQGSARAVCSTESQQACRNQCLSYGADGGSCSSGVCRCFYW